MTVIFGGAYQGKLAYAKEHYALLLEDIFYCDENSAEVDFSKKAIGGLHLALLCRVRNGEDCVAWAKSVLPMLQDKIVLCDDVSAGVVPAEADLRAWREAVGRVLALLCQNAQEVIRLFCGLETRLR